MPNVNFKNFQQMGSLVSDIVKQATGREPVDNIDMDYVTVAQSQRAIKRGTTGSSVTFETNNTFPLDSVIAEIEVKQSGSGDPSSENVRNFVGFTKCVISQTGDETENTYEIAFGTDAGTVYGGVLNVTTGTLYVDWVYRRISSITDGTGSYSIVAHLEDNANYEFITLNNPNLTKHVWKSFTIQSSETISVILKTTYDDNQVLVVDGFTDAEGNEVLVDSSLYSVWYEKNEQQTYITGYCTYNYYHFCNYYWP